MKSNITADVNRLMARCWPNAGQNLRTTDLSPLDLDFYSSVLHDVLSNSNKNRKHIKSISHPCVHSFLLNPNESNANPNEG